MRQEKMSLKSKRELLAALRMTYNNASYSEKNRLLDGFQTATGYSRKHCIKLLRSEDSFEKKQRAPKSTPYNEDVKNALSVIWQAASCICSKRLIPFLPDFIPALERFGHITLQDDTRESLLTLSPATADRLLKSERQRLGRSMSMTRRGTLLRRQIAVRTFADWDDAVPGFFEADLVAHNGGNASGHFIHTLTLTDISSGWTECMPVIRKTDDNVLAALEKIRQRLPMPLIGLDTDNGTEFINHNLSKYCERENITFTRSRVFKSNDQCHVEEKNGSVVRKFVGFRRFEGEWLCWLMKEIYELTSLYVNYFQPSLKLESKERTDKHVTKRYLKARTPCQRLLEIRGKEKMKRELRKTFLTLNPVELLTQIHSLQTKLDESADELLRSLPGTTAVADSEKLILQVNEEKPVAKEPAPRRAGKKPLVTEEVAQVVGSWLHQDPRMTATGLLPLLEKRFPGRFGNKQWATLARHIHKWRAQHPEYKRFYPKFFIYYDEKTPTCQGVIFNESTRL